MAAGAGKVGIFAQSVRVFLLAVLACLLQPVGNLAHAAPGPLGPPIGAIPPRLPAKPKPVPQVPGPTQPPQNRAPVPSGGLGQPVGGAGNPIENRLSMFGDGDDSYGIEMSLWPEDMETTNGLLQWRVNIVRFSPLVSSNYRTPVRPDGFVTGIGKVSATMSLSQNGTCTSVLSIDGAPIAKIEIACSNGPGLMFRVLKPLQPTRWIAIVAVFREAEGSPTVVQEFLADMRLRTVSRITDYRAEGFVVDQCSGEARILWNSESARRLGLTVNECLMANQWPSDDGRLRTVVVPVPRQPLRPAPEPIVKPDAQPTTASPEETAAWIRLYYDRFLGGQVTVSVKALARARDFPTSDGSRILRELQAGETVSGTWVMGRDPATRWLKLANTNGYVWDGNLAEMANDPPLHPYAKPTPKTLGELLAAIDSLPMTQGRKIVVKEMISQFGGTSEFPAITRNIKYARLANAAYEVDPSVEGWQDISYKFSGLTENKETGFKAHVFQNDSEIVISIMGTDPNKKPYNNMEDWWDTNRYRGKAQKPDAEKLFQAVRVSCSCNVTLTGHSLGGGLTQYLAVKFGAKGVAFDPAPFAEFSVGMADSFTNLISFRNKSDPVTLLEPEKLAGRMVTVANTISVANNRYETFAYLSTNHSMDNLLNAMTYVEFAQRVLVENGIPVP